MRKFSSLHSMTFYRERLILPHIESDDDTKENKTKGSILYLLNTSKDGIVKLLNNEHDLLSNQGFMYKTYYYDHLKLPKCVVSPKVKTVLIRPAKAKAERLVDYKEISSLVSNVLTPISLSAAAGRNILYDLMPVERLYSGNKKISNLYMRPKMNAFFDTYQNITSSEFGDYKNTCILVDLDEYHNYTGTNSMNHILNNLMLLLRRSEKFIQKFNHYTMKFLFYTNKGYFVFDMSTDVVKENLTKLRQIIKRCGIRGNPDTAADMTEKIEIAKKLTDAVTKSNAVGNTSIDIEDEPSDVEQDEELAKNDSLLVSPDDDIVKTVDDKIDDVEDLDDSDKMDEIESEVFKDEITKKEYIDAITNTKTHAKTNASIKRDQMLREKQKDIVIKTKTIGQLAKEVNVPDIESDEITKLPKTYTNVRNVKFSNFEKTYMDEVYEKHISEVITCLNDKTIPVNIVSIKVEDTSDNLTMKETYTVLLEDERRVRHTLKFNLPKFIDNKFIYVNGNKKTIQKQFFCYPVVKTGPDEVQICTNYNKVFISRVGTKFSQNSERLRKFLDDEKIANLVTFRRGCNTAVNKDYLTCLEYDEFAKSYNEIIIGSATFLFNAKNLDESLGGKYKSDLDKILVGYNTIKGKKEPIFYDRHNPDHEDLISLMVSYLSEETQAEFRKITVGKKYVHTEATILTKKIPVVVLLCFFEGLDTVVRKFNDPTVVFSDKNSLGNKYMYIKFADGYLCYPMSNIEACMMFNGLTEVSTSLYTIEEMNNRTTYLDIFQDIAGSSYIAGGLINYYDFMIDPITLDVLNMLHYPTDIVSLFIFANNMLADNSYISDQNLNQYRLRDNEIVAAILYKNIARSYARYRSTVNNPNPVKISMDENAVIKEIIALPTVEDYSTLSPMVELHKSSTVSMKGANGLNLDRAYKLDKRAFDDSMIGVCGLSTDPGPNCGKIRQLVAEPTVTNALGFMDLNNRKDVSSLTDTQLSVPVEMLTPGASTHDDPNRNAMTTKQTCHVIPVENNCPVLISTGMDQAVHYRTGNDFSVTAAQDGKVIEKDDVNHIMVVQYKNGVKQAIDTAPHVVKNGGGGFYLVNQLVSELKNGQSFKKDDILAYDPKYYKEQNVLGNRLTMGTLVKVACFPNFATFEDSTFVTKHMSESMATNITMQKTIVIGHNANVEYIVKPGDKIRIGDDLIRYETSYDDEELDKLLSNVRSDMKEEIINLGKSRLQSSYTGVVSDVVIYSTADLDELSPSLKKIVKNYQDGIKAKEKVLNKYDKNDKAIYRMGVLMDKPGSTVKPDEYGKVKGQDVGLGVLIEFYVTYHDELSDGDKLAAFTANKNTIGYQVKRGYEPYSTFRPYEEISSPVAPSAILQRNTPSVVTTGCCYKVLIELKRKMYNILTGGDYNDILKQKQPYMNTDSGAATEMVNVHSRELTESEVFTLEQIYDLHKSDDGYVSPKCYCEGDMILALNDSVDMSKMIDNFKLSSDCSNATFDYDRGMIIASKKILPYDNIILDLTI